MPASGQAHADGPCSAARRPAARTGNGVAHEDVGRGFGVPPVSGGHVKYMLTGDVEGVSETEDLEEGWDYTNVTVGLQFGFLIH